MPPLKIKDMREKLLKILKNLKPTKRGGVDKQAPRVLKEVAEEIVDVVVMIFEESLKTAEVPQDWLNPIQGGGVQNCTPLWFFAPTIRKN